MSCYGTSLSTRQVSTVNWTVSFGLGCPTMSASRTNTIAWIGFACLFCGLLFVTLVMGRPLLIEIPAGYKGWVIVRVEDAHCPVLATRGLFRVVSVPSSGKVCTSSPELLKHPSYVRFENVYPDGKRKSLPWSGSGGDTWAEAWMLGYGIEDHEQDIFIGDVHDMNNSGPPPHYNMPSGTK